MVWPVGAGVQACLTRVPTVLERQCVRPHRLEAQDVGFSARKPGFDSPWGYLNSRILRNRGGYGCFFFDATPEPGVCLAATTTLDESRHGTGGLTLGTAGSSGLLDLLGLCRVLARMTSPLEGVSSDPLGGGLLLRSARRPTISMRAVPSAPTRPPTTMPRPNLESERLVEIAALCREAIQAQRERETRQGYGLDDYTEGRIVGAANLARKILRAVTANALQASGPKNRRSSLAG